MPAEIPSAVAVVCAGAVYFGNARRSVWAAKLRELVACVETPVGIGNAVASWVPPVGVLRP